MGIKLRERLEKKKKSMQMQMQRGRERTEQIRAEKLRRRSKRVVDMKDGTCKTIAVGLATKQKPWDVMKSEYERRKYEREQKYKEK